MPRRLLDAGCGSGINDLLMASFGFVEQIFAIDYSKKSIEAANREFTHPKIRREVSDIVDLKPQLIDLVVSFQVIEHLTDPEALLIECQKQSSDGGWITVLPQTVNV